MTPTLNQEQPTDLPLLPAEELLSQEVSARPLPSEDTTGTATTTTEMLRVYAPCDLPPNYLLTVEANNGELVDVLVPEPGVFRGQAFEAQRVACQPILGDWSNDLWDCWSSNILWVGCLANEWVYAAVLERMRLDWQGQRGNDDGSYRETFAIVRLIWFAAIFLFPALIALTGFFQAWAVLVLTYLYYLCWMRTRSRIAVREKYSIEGSALEDCCVTYWCSCCAALQMHRHMKLSGDTPRPFQKLGRAEIV